MFTKIAFALVALIYVISPFDLIPDFLIPYLGWIDDTALIAFLLYFLRTGKIPNILSGKWRSVFGNSRSGSGFEAGKRKANSSDSSRSGYSGQQGHNRYEQASGREGYRSTDEHTEKKSPRETPYDILGVSPGAGETEIRQAYKTLAKQYHPDRTAHLGPDIQELAARRFREINDAYQALISK